jgi:DNA-binding NarL/FixJ family response regulator
MTLPQTSYPPDPNSRQAQVLDLILQGQSNKQIAHALQLSTRTVEAHRSKVLGRMGVRTSYEAMALVHARELAQLHAEIDHLHAALRECQAAASKVTGGQS